MLENSTEVGDRMYSTLDGKDILYPDYAERCYGAGMRPAVIRNRQDMEAAAGVCGYGHCWIGEACVKVA